VKPLIIAEKPKQAQAYADALGGYEKKDGFIEIKSNAIFPNGAYLSWGIGHLVTLAEPSEYKKEWGGWNEETLKSLPIAPKEFKFVVSETKQKQFSIIESLLKQVQEVIIATDVDREGENIAWSILKQANAEDKTVKRLWFNSLEKDVLIQSFKTLRDGREFYPSYKEAQTRQISDWLIGMNLSKLYTIKLRENGFRETFSVGRVQTPTLFMIYEREKAIREFVPQPFYEINAEAEQKGVPFIMKSGLRFDTANEASETLHRNMMLNPTLVVVDDVTDKESEEQSPQLYTMSGLQTKANKKWKYSPQKTLELVQSLYEKKFLSYPRTDTPFITESEFDYLKERIEPMRALLGIELPIRHIEPRRRYVDSNKVQEHYAIIPTKQILTTEKLASLSQDEQNIYMEVVKTTMAMFCESARYAKTTVKVRQKELTFTANGKVEIDKGWKVIFQDEEKKSENKKEERLPVIRRGDELTLKGVIKEGKTTPPKRLTEGDLIPLMKNAGSQLDEEEQSILKETEGIGTEATRSNIIETLKNKEYINVEKNLVYCTPKGEILSKVVEGTLLASPQMTAQWEDFLRKIGKSERNQESFLNGINKFILSMLEQAPTIIAQSDVAAFAQKQSESESVGKCPTCKKGNIIDKGTFYGCTNYSNGCKQVLDKERSGKKLSNTQIAKLLSKGQTDVIKGFNNKDKTKKFDARLMLEDHPNGSTKRITFKFEKAKEKTK
jgi:DNA topoisomerase-3